MTQEEKQLLLKELCSRLPYGVKCHFKYGTSEDDIILKCIDGNVARFDYGWYGKFHVIIDHQYIKPYLRPMSSMTEEELNKCVCQSGIKDIECPNWQDIPKEKQFEARLNHAIAVFLTDSNNVDWLNAHHLDYRGLIEKGLAIEAPEGMYN